MLMVSGMFMFVNVMSSLMSVLSLPPWLRSAQPMSGGAVTAVLTDYCAKLCRNPRPIESPIYRYLGKSTMRTLLLIKASDVETNPGPTTTHKQVWIYDICHKQIHGMKQISIWCNRIEHWVHLSCAGFRLAQYTDTWTCNLHK